MQQLSEVRDNIKTVRLTLPVETIDDYLITNLTSAVRKSRGKALLKLTLCDRREGVTLNLFSRKHKVAMAKELTEFIKQNEIAYAIE